MREGAEYNSAPSPFAADAGLRISSISGQSTHVLPGRLGVDGQAVATGDVDALAGGQLTPVRQDEIHVAGDGDAGVNINLALHNVPAAVRIAAGPCGAAGGHGNCLHIFTFIISI